MRRVGLERAQCTRSRPTPTAGTHAYPPPKHAGSPPVPHWGAAWNPDGPPRPHSRADEGRSMSMTLDDRKAGEPVVTVVTDGPVKLVAEVGVAPEPRAWHRWKTIFLILLPLLMVLYVCLAARGILGVVEYRPPEAVALVRGEPDGAALYAQNCARCHGIGGEAGGPAG